MRVKTSVSSKKRKKRLLKQTKGFWGQRKNVFRRAKETLLRSLAFSYRDRRVKKRTFRALWIVRINAGCRNNGITYSKFISGLKKSGVELDRKILSEIAVSDKSAFAQLVETAKASTQP